MREVRGSSGKFQTEPPVTDRFRKPMSVGAGGLGSPTGRPEGRGKSVKWRVVHNRQGVAAASGRAAVSSQAERGRSTPPPPLNKAVEG